MSPDPEASLAGAGAGAGAAPFDEATQAEQRLDLEAARRLLEVSRRLNAERDLDAVLAAVVDGLVAMTRADRGFLMLREGDGLRFTIARDKRGRPLEAERFRVSESVAREVAESGHPKLIDDASSSAAYGARQSIVDLALRTILCVPLKTPRGVLGVIYVDSNLITRRFTERDVPLVEAFASQAAVTLERVRLEHAEVERDRLRVQLETAAEIQRTFLPGTFPESPGLRGAVATVPAQHVGGDLYDVIRFPDGRTGLVVGDVSGKGIPAALFGARLLSDVRYAALFHDDVAATLRAMSQVVSRRSTRGMFVTMAYAIFEPVGGEVTYGNAGHVAPLVRSADGEVRTWSGAAGLPLGVFPDASYEAETRVLAPGETLVIASDGVLDALSPLGDRFGEERLHATLAAGPRDPAELLAALLAAVSTFSATQEPADDLTCLAVART